MIYEYSILGTYQLPIPKALKNRLDPPPRFLTLAVSSDDYFGWMWSDGLGSMKLLMDGRNIVPIARLEKELVSKLLDDIMREANIRADQDKKKIYSASGDLIKRVLADARAYRPLR